MKVTNIARLGLCVLLVLAASACGMAEYSSAYIADAWLSSDEAGENRTTTFGADATFYAKADLESAPEGTLVEGSWVEVEAEGQEPNYEIDRTPLETGSNRLNFSLAMPNPWPLGAYAFDLYLDGALDRRLDFTVE